MGRNRQRAAALQPGGRRLLRRVSARLPCLRPSPALFHHIACRACVADSTISRVGTPAKLRCAAAAVMAVGFCLCAAALELWNDWGLARPSPAAPAFCVAQRLEQADQARPRQSAGALQRRRQRQSLQGQGAHAARLTAQERGARRTCGASRTTGEGRRRRPLLPAVPASDITCLCLNEVGSRRTKERREEQASARQSKAHEQNGGGGGGGGGWGQAT